MFMESLAPVAANDVLDVLYQWAHENPDILAVNVEVFNIGD